MSKQLILQVLSALGIVIFVPVLYLGLMNDQEVLATIGFVVFGLCMLLTPALRFLSRRNNG